MGSVRKLIISPAWTHLLMKRLKETISAQNVHWKVKGVWSSHLGQVQNGFAQKEKVGSQISEPSLLSCPRQRQSRIQVQCKIVRAVRVATVSPAAALCRP